MKVAGWLSKTLVEVMEMIRRMVGSKLRKTSTPIIGALSGSRCRLKVWDLLTSSVRELGVSSRLAANTGGTRKIRETKEIRVRWTNLLIGEEIVLGEDPVVGGVDYIIPVVIC